MALKTFVKVGNVNNLSDARYCAGMEVNLLGFPFDGENFVTPDTFREISGWLSGLDYVAEFSKSDSYEIKEIVSNCQVSYIQVSSAELIGQLADTLPLILSVDVNSINSVEAGLPVDFLVLTGELTGEYTSAFRESLVKLCNSYKVLLGSGINPKNVETLINSLPIHGVSMNGSEEIRPGYKDYDELADILEILEKED